MTEILKTPPLSETLPEEPLVRGQWYWVQDKDWEGDSFEWLGCITNIGSNYVELDGPTHGPRRVHVDEFDRTCRRELDPESVIRSRVEENQARVKRLMGEVQELTARLAIGPGPELGTGEECRSLAVVGSQQSFSDYSKALAKAKKEDLPELFKKIENANKSMAAWMSANVIPLKAEAEAMKGVIEKIEDRVFNVELYAGLVESVTVCQDGEPAPLGEKIHLLQRRHYMDEECLAHYEIGGMEFKDIEAFDEWICRKVHRDRLLPFPRCIVAFKVRRNAKWREAFRVSDYFQILQLEEADKTTFLYMRNGDRVYRLNTAIEFGEQLFPDIRKLRPDDKIWAKVWSNGHIEKIITEGDYLQRKSEWEAAEREREEKLRKAKKKDRWQFQSHSWSEWRDYKPFDHTNVYYDDINATIQSDLKKHNRVALVLQGILDRSPVFHPHPPWQIWTEEGFAQALELVYDDAYALVSGPPPDFEAYRAKLNKTLKVGCTTIGQQDFWQRQEAVKENRQRSNDPRFSRIEYELTFYTPPGNPGPGKLARPIAVTRTGKCTFAWNRERQTSTWKHRYGDPIPVKLEVAASKLLNLDAYTPGDFRQFFADPRTRANYLKWAPYLLEAEEYKAGNRKVGQED